MTDSVHHELNFLIITFKQNAYNDQQTHRALNPIPKPAKCENKPPSVALLIIRTNDLRTAQQIVVQIYRVSQEECARIRESVPYVKLHRYNPKHLYPKLNGYGDNGQRSLKL